MNSTYWESSRFSIIAIIIVLCWCAVEKCVEECHRKLFFFSQHLGMHTSSPSLSRLFSYVLCHAVSKCRFLFFARLVSFSHVPFVKCVEVVMFSWLVYKNKLWNHWIKIWKQVQYDSPPLKIFTDFLGVGGNFKQY